MLEAVPKNVANSGEGSKQELERSRRFQLARLLQKTETILCHAQKGEWQAVENLERERQLELANCFQQVDNEASAVIVEALATLLHMNKQITRLVEAAKRELIATQQAKENRQSAAKEYQWSE